jgi:hypothetical protein
MLKRYCNESNLLHNYLYQDRFEIFHTDYSSSQDNGALQNKLRSRFQKGFNNAGAQNLSPY